MDHLDDSIQDRLDSVNRRLHRRSFLQTLTSSQLPSQAASETSVSPPLPPLLAGKFARSPLSAAISSDVLDLDSVSDDGLDHRLTAILTADGAAYSAGRVEPPRAECQRLEQLQHDFAKAWAIFANMTTTTERGFVTFDHEHADLVLAVDFNYYGNRMVTASSDHRLKVWDKKDDTWALLDSWKAHDAEITDVKWNGPFLGAIIGSIAEDGKFKIWQEDVTEGANSGRRFHSISTQLSETRVPFMSLDWKNILTETYVALITRDGFLSIFEPQNHEDLKQWQPLHQRWIGPTPSRQDETSFKVCFHKEQLPCYLMIQAGLDKKALSIAVAAMNSVKIFRTDASRQFYQAAEITGARSIIRDVAWANGSMRGYDVIATAGKDGALRVFELHAVQSQTTGIDGSADQIDENRPPDHSSRAVAPSGISAGLAGSTTVADKSKDLDGRRPGRVRNQVKKVADVMPHHGAVWRVAFSQLGDLLVSTGDDGVVKTWKKAINGQWLEYAAIDVVEPE